MQISQDFMPKDVIARDTHYHALKWANFHQGKAEVQIPFRDDFSAICQMS